MPFWIALPASLLPLAIFFLRVVEMSLDTLRVLFVIRGSRLPAMILGVCQSALWVVAVASVISNLDKPLNAIAYAGGFASGTVVGMFIEERLALGHRNLRVISSKLGNAIAEEIRSAGYAATELAGRGKDGTVTLINSSVRRRDIATLQARVRQIDPQAFISIEEVVPLHRGFWRA